METKSLAKLKEESARLKQVRNYINQVVYKEPPVKVLTFLEKNEFLGKATRNMQEIFPGWLPIIEDIFDDDSKYLIVLSGATSTGKTAMACRYCMPYILYKIMNMRNPFEFFEKGETGEMDVYFFNLTRKLSGSRGFGYLQNAIMQSPWFLNHGGYIRGGNDPYMKLPIFNWVLASPYTKGFGALGGNLISGVMDEVDSPNEPEGQRKRILQAYDASVRRFEGRFVKGGKSIGRMFLVSSKQEEHSFLEVFIEEMRHSDKVKIIEKAQWEIRPKSNYKGGKFLISLGDPYIPPKIIEPEERDQHIKMGFEIMEVPDELKEEYVRDMEGALRDFSGRSVKSIRARKFIQSERMIRDCFDSTKLDPIAQVSIDIGLQDTDDLIHYIGLSKIRVPLKFPRCVHIDIGFTEDALGMGCSVVSGYREMQVEQPDGTFSDARMPVVETDFAMRLKARENDRIPIHKVRKLILTLIEYGLNIRHVTIDLRIAAEDTIQLLQKAHIDCEHLSLDKTPLPYLDFRNLIYEGRWICHWQPWLFFELKNLEIAPDTGKVDHPTEVIEQELVNGVISKQVAKGSKDLCDGVCGSVYLAVTKTHIPPDAKQYARILHDLKNRNNPIQGMPEDWFISQKARETLFAGAGGPLLGTHHVSKTNAEKLKETLQELRKRKAGGFL